MPSPSFSFQSSKELVDYFLPKVSRTFAINIRVLNADDYIAVGLAYLICRILDSVEDSQHLSESDKALLLRDFAYLFKKGRAAHHYPAWVKKIRLYTNSKALIKTGLSVWEEDLLQNTNGVIQAFSNLPKLYQGAFKPAILEMAVGMALFIEKYQSAAVKVLETQAELDEYCLVVAGTVGDLLTKLFSLHLKEAYNIERRKKLLGLYADFAYSLQSINILKDFQVDRDRKWVYIPKEAMKKHGLSLRSFLKQSEPGKLKALHSHMLARTDKSLEKALIYIETLPLHLFRYRWFCWLPLAMAIRSSKLLKKADFHRKEKPYRHKISRKEVIIISVSAPFFVLHNSFLRIAFFLAKKL